MYHTPSPLSEGQGEAAQSLSDVGGTSLYPSVQCMWATSFNARKPCTLSFVLEEPGKQGPFHEKRGKRASPQFGSACSLAVCTLCTSGSLALTSASCWLEAFLRAGTNLFIPCL